MFKTQLWLPNEDLILFLPLKLHNRPLKFHSTSSFKSKYKYRPYFVSLCFYMKSEQETVYSISSIFQDYYNQNTLFKDKMSKLYCSLIIGLLCNLYCNLVLLLPLCIHGIIAKTSCCWQEISEYKGQQLHHYNHNHHQQQQNKNNNSVYIRKIILSCIHIHTHDCSDITNKKCIPLK